MTGILRVGLAASEERTNVINASAVLPVDPVTGAISPTPFSVTDQSSITGWNIGTYAQDEWKLTNNLTLNVGLRFDQLYQYVDANQFSPRVALVYKPFVGTSIHAGYARYFTPPFQAQAATANLALFTNTTNQPEVLLADPVKPERSNYCRSQQSAEHIGQGRASEASPQPAASRPPLGVIRGDTICKASIAEATRIAQTPLCFVFEMS